MAVSLSGVEVFFGLEYIWTPKLLRISQPKDVIFLILLQFGKGIFFLVKFLHLIF